MIKKDLTGNKQTITLEGLERPQFLTFQDVGINTTIKAEIQRVGLDNNKIVTTILLPKMHEAQQKIKRLVDSTANINPFTFIEEEGFCSNLTVQLSIDGEIPFLDINDKLVITLDNMDNTGGFMFILGSSKTSQKLYKFLDQNYEGKNDEMRLDVEKFDFLVFDKHTQKFPVQIEKFYESDVDRENYPQFVTKQNILFGVVSYKQIILSDTNILQPVIGGDYSIVVDVRGLQTLLLKDDRGLDYKFHGVKFE